MDNNKLGAVTPPTLHITSLRRSRKRCVDSTPGLGTPKSDDQPVDTFAGAEDATDATLRPPTLYTRCSIHFVLGNFFVAIPLISLIIFVIFFAVTWFVLWDARSLNLRVFSNSTGVSLCLYHDERTSLMAFVVIVVNTRRQPSTGSRGICIIYFMECPHLRCGHDSWGSVLGRSCPCPLRTVRRGT